MHYFILCYYSLINLYTFTPSYLKCLFPFWQEKFWLIFLKFKQLFLDIYHLTSWVCFYSWIVMFIKFLNLNRSFGQKKI
jgi:hypothetical protein